MVVSCAKITQTDPVAGDAGQVVLRIFMVLKHA
jgi:hypothetical protein